jgi:hypothetical protein
MQAVPETASLPTQDHHVGTPEPPHLLCLALHCSKPQDSMCLAPAVLPLHSAAALYTLPCPATVRRTWIPPDMTHAPAATQGAPVMHRVAMLYSCQRAPS